jgi:NAD(P)-dependent dehydrogenase (short-subunit alcohol dehydrogenase family)
MSNAKVAAVVGVGPGLGGAAALRFARAGYRVALLARGEDKLGPVAAAIAAAGGSSLGVTCDATEPTEVHAAYAAFERIRAEAGDPELAVYNAGAFKMAGVLELSPEEFEAAWRANCAGGFHLAQAVLPGMLERGAGTLIFTGATAALRGSARFAALSVGKFGLRALAQSLAREFGPRGIHVAHVIIDGMIDLPRTRAMMPDRTDEGFLRPEAIAESYLQLHLQDRRAWTHELDLRPHVEKF